MRKRLGELSTKVGLAGAIFLALAFCLTGFALANGIHCPGCDRPPAYEAWETYFVVKEVVYGVALVMLVVALPLSPLRSRFLVGALLALVAFSLTPK